MLAAVAFELAVYQLTDQLEFEAARLEGEGYLALVGLAGS
jgi:hypothetical protein